MEQTHQRGRESAANQTKRPIYADKAAAYWWEMLMNFDQKVDRMVGYGKIEGHRENKSKDQNLMRIINMLYSNGYFSKTREINLYERLSPLANKNTDFLVAQITGGQIVYFGSSWDVKAFLQNFENILKNGIKPKVHLRPVTK